MIVGGKISIHALREEGDLDALNNAEKNQKISIHALREEGDVPGALAEAGLTKFLSTPSVRRATGIVVVALAQLNHFYPRPP